MIEVVFISDLHLHPDRKDITERFNQFIAWAQDSVKNIYILGDFFHAWAGDDSIDAWSRGIAKRLFALKKQGINLFFMHGNRDFLLGEHFAKLAGWTVLAEPTLLQLDNQKILLVHGDRYCTKDRAHQWFRLCTRNKLFAGLFLSLPLKYRTILVHQVRKRSQMNHDKPKEIMDVVVSSVIKHMERYQVKVLIHGHTHKPGLSIYQHKTQALQRFVLSDWDDNPQILCYDITKGFNFILI